MEDATNKKYKTEDAYFKNFLVAKFLNCRRVVSKYVGSQVHELQLIFHDMISWEMVLNDVFSSGFNDQEFASIVERLQELFKVEA